MADPAPIVLAHVKVVVIVELEAGMAELARALILRLLSQLQVSL